MKNLLTPLAKSILIPLGLTAAAAATDAVIQKKIGSGMTALIISNEEIGNIMKIVKSLRGSGLLIKDVSETIKSEAKEQKGGFLGMLLGTLSASMLGNMLAGKLKIPGTGVIRAGEGVTRASEGTTRAGQSF